MYFIKMRAATSQNRELVFDSNLQFNYEPIHETIFTFNHPLVIKETDQFIDQAKSKNIFNRFQKKIGNQKKRNALIVSSCWHQFSMLMPQLLCYAAFRVKSNLLRHYIIQVPFEELGMREAKEIHPRLFYEAQKAMNIGFFKPKKKLKSLNYLKRAFLKKIASDSYVLGLLLGLEIPGEENIATVLHNMSYDELASKRLKKTKFFQIHKSIEIEHIRLNTSNYIRFCKSKKQKDDFQKGFNKGLLFWEKFWNEVAEI